MDGVETALVKFCKLFTEGEQVDNALLCLKKFRFDLRNKLRSSSPLVKLLAAAVAELINVFIDELVGARNVCVFTVVVDRGNGGRFFTFSAFAFSFSQS